MKHPAGRSLRWWAWAGVAALLGVGIWLGLRAGLVERVYVYTDGDSLREVEGGSPVRSVSWSLPREVPDEGAAAAGRAAARTTAAEDGLAASAATLLLAARGPEGDLDLFARELTTAGWSRAVPLPGAVNSRSDEVGPTLAAGGDLLCFASNRPGGRGGFDLYSSRRGLDGWQEPVNLGGRVNSPYDDTGPTIHPTGAILCFATARPRSFILSPPADWSAVILQNWKAAPEEVVYASLLREPGKDPRWSAPRPLEALGSSARDLDPCFSPAGEYLYFASDREGGLGGLDIFRAHAGTMPDGSSEEQAGALSLRAERPASVGAPINTLYDDREPRVFLEGFAIAYRAGVRGTGVEKHFESRAREVEPELAFASIPLSVLGENLARLAALLLGGAALVLGAVLFFRFRAALRPNLLLRCAAAAVLVHAAMLYGFYFWIVSDEIVARAERAVMAEVSVEKVLQAKLSAEASRIEVRAPDARPTAEPPPPTAERTVATPAGEAEATLALAIFAPTGAPAPVLEPAVEAGFHPIDERELPSSREIARPIAIPGPGSAAASPAMRLVAPRPAPAAPDPALKPALAAAVEASWRVSDSSPRPGPVSPDVFLAGSTEISTAELFVQIAWTQVAAPAPQTTFLPPTARPMAALGPASLPAPAPASEPEPAAATDVLAGMSFPAVTGSREVTVAMGSPEPPPDTRVDADTAPARSALPVLPLPAPRDFESAREIGAALPESPPRIAPLADADLIGSRRLASAATLPTKPLLPGAPAAEDRDSGLDGLAPRPAERHSQPGPLLPGLIASSGGPVDAPLEVRPLTASSSGLGAVTAAAPLRLASEPRPGALFSLLAGAPPAAAPGKTPTLPEGEGARRAGRGSREVADILEPSARPSSRVAAPTMATSPGEERREPVPEPSARSGLALLPHAKMAPRARSAPGARRGHAGPVGEASAASGTLTPPADPKAGDSVSVASASFKLPEAPPELQGETDLRKVRSTAARKALVGLMGGTTESEDAVLLALRWLARHQSPDGRWDIDGFDERCQGCRSPGFHVDCDAAVTGLAVLCYLGQNHTPASAESPFRKNVRAAVDWLVSVQAADGSLAGADARYTMYSHGIATLALSEAYALTQEKKLLPPLRRAVRLILTSQNPTTGGWRYRPKPPLRGDTSITGWQVLALASARNAGVEVPQSTLERARHWLDVEVSGGQHRGIYGYTRPEEPRVAMVAEGMFARLLLGGKRTDRNIEEAARYVFNETRTGGHLDNFYLLYYGNLALYHYQGWIWERWNEEVREFLVRSQHRSGTLAGSWDPTGPWSETGGRVLSTCLATLTLEVYYRYLPLYWMVGKDGD